MKTIKAIGVKEVGKPFAILQSQSFRSTLDALPEGRYWLKVDRFYKKITGSQRGYLYGYIYPLSLIALNDVGYEFTNTDQVNDFWMALFASKDILNRETGEIIRLPLSKSEFSTVDQMAYIDQIRNYCAEYLGVYIDEPDANWKTK